MAAHELWLVRHGESVANLAATAAEAAGLDVVTVDLRDADVPLSEAGEEQAAALGEWLASLPDSERPTSAWASSYLRARQTAQIALEPFGGAVPIVSPPPASASTVPPLSRATRRIAKSAKGSWFCTHRGSR